LILLSINPYHSRNACDNSWVIAGSIHEVDGGAYYD